MTIKILIADDHPLVREGIRFVLNRMDAEKHIDEAKDFNEVLTFLKQNPDLKLIMLDLSMPGMDGITSIVELQEKYPETFIIIVSATADINTIREAINSGAKGYIHKSSNNEIMINAVQLVLAGGLYLPPQWTEAEFKTSPPEAEILTSRQQEVISLLAIGKSNKEIAKEFSISDKTVKAHLSEIFKRLNADNRTHAVHYARQLGLIQDNV